MTDVEVELVSTQVHCMHGSTKCLNIVVAVAQHFVFNRNHESTCTINLTLDLYGHVLILHIRFV